MQPYETAREKIINGLDLRPTTNENQMLELTLKWLFSMGMAKAMIATEKLKQERTKAMTEKKVLETKIEHLEGRKRLINAEIDFKLRMLNEALDLQKGFEVGGRYGFRFEIFEED